MKFSNKVYDILKWIAQYLLPACGTLYFALARIWGLPYAEEIVGTVTAIDTFLGVMLGISSHNYQGEGTMLIDTSDPQHDLYSLNLNVPIEDLANMDMIMFKVDGDSNG